jgi:hypothetical protein
MDLTTTTRVSAFFVLNPCQGKEHTRRPTFLHAAAVAPWREEQTAKIVAARRVGKWQIGRIPKVLLSPVIPFLRRGAIRLNVLHMEMSSPAARTVIGYQHGPEFSNLDWLRLDIRRNGINTGSTHHITMVA